MTGDRLAAAALIALYAAGCGEPAPSELSVEPYRQTDRGAIEVKGDTRDWYGVSRAGKTVGGNPPMLNTTRELEPGGYEVSVNKSLRRVSIVAGKKTVLLTGSLVVEGSGANWWYPEQGGERRVAANPPLPGRALALFSGTYGVHVHVANRTEKLADAQVAAGKRTVLTR